MINKDFVIVKSHPDMISYVDKLQRANSDSLSFYPLRAFEREVESAKGRIFLGLLNNQPCGYIYIGTTGKTIQRMFQVCIEYDARRSAYGAQLVVAVEDYALEHGSSRIVFGCGFDLDANNFWQAMGYKCVDSVQGAIRRNRQINIWVKSLQEPLFEDVEVEPAQGKINATIWRKHRRTGIVSQFTRGKRLKEYRTQLIALEDATRNKRAGGMIGNGTSGNN